MRNRAITKKNGEFLRLRFPDGATADDPFPISVTAFDANFVEASVPGEEGLAYVRRHFDLRFTERHGQRREVYAKAIVLQRKVCDRLERNYDSLVNILAETPLTIRS